MQPPNIDPTKRFSNRVVNYVRCRPAYPKGVLQVLREEAGLTSASVIADVGSGTGISSELFLQHGNKVFGVEPNAEMRRAAEARFGQLPNFCSISASAEATTLPSGSIDYVVAGQAFHWFDVPKTKQEFARVLRPGGWAVLIWNSRRSNSTPFLRSYEALLQRHGTDYQQVQHRNVDIEILRTFFANEDFAVRSLYNEQRFDFEGLKGRLLSSSYAPTPKHPNYELMLSELELIFQQYGDENGIRIEYDTELYLGHVV